MSRVAHSQFMLCYILLQPSELWAQFGLIGHFRWNATVARSCTTSEANGSPMQASTSTLPSQAQLTHITLLYNLHEKLQLKPPTSHDDDVCLPSCEPFIC